MNFEDRLGRLAAAELRANRREFDLRYGNARRHPYGVSRQRFARRGKRPNWRLDLGLALLSLVVTMTYFALV